MKRKTTTGLAILGAGLYLTLIGLLAVGLGFLVRSTAGGIATLFGVVLVLPLLTNLLAHILIGHHNSPVDGLRCNQRSSMHRQMSIRLPD